MTIHRKILIAVLLGALSPLSAAPFGVDLFGNKAEGVEKKHVEKKRFEKKLWDKPAPSRFQDKSFPIKEWNKHFSSLGSKRAPITTSDTNKKKLFETKVMDREIVDFEMSRWNDRMADLYKRAGIQVDDKAKSIADRRLYETMLQDARQYRELGEELSLRDLNRFQFRRNHTADGVPVKKAGEGE